MPSARAARVKAPDSLGDAQRLCAGPVEMKKRIRSAIVKRTLFGSSYFVATR
jgi:hypothetical protein